jgi:steroid delta-isomerase-like uncharacterized protein
MAHAPSATYGLERARHPPGSGRRRNEMSDANKALSRRFTALFGEEDLAHADEILGRDVVMHGTAGGEDLRGIDAAVEFIREYRTACPDARSTVEDQVAEGDKVVTRWRARGTHQGDLGPIAATGRSFDVAGITIERVDDGRIAEVWVVRDWLGFLQQLGVLPELVGSPG